MLGGLLCIVVGRREGLLVGVVVSMGVGVVVGIRVLILLVGLGEDLEGRWVVG